MKEIQQQRSRHIGAKKARIRRAIRAADPYPDGVCTGYSHRPSVAEAETGACFPGNALPGAGPRPQMLIHRAAGCKDIADDKGSPSRKHAPFLQCGSGRIPWPDSHTTTGQATVGTHQLFQAG